MKMSDIKKALDEGLPGWPPELQQMVRYTRLHDDHEGKYEGTLTVVIGPDGDAWVDFDNPRGGAIRFRNFHGGGMSLRVQTALTLLAWAIMLDNKERPIQLPDQK